MDGRGDSRAWDDELTKAGGRLRYWGRGDGFWIKGSLVVSSPEILFLQIVRSFASWGCLIWLLLRPSFPEALGGLWWSESTSVEREDSLLRLRGRFRSSKGPQRSMSLGFLLRLTPRSFDRSSLKVISGRFHVRFAFLVIPMVFASSFWHSIFIGLTWEKHKLVERNKGIYPWSPFDKLLHNKSTELKTQKPWARRKMARVSHAFQLTSHLPCWDSQHFKQKRKNISTSFFSVSPPKKTHKNAKRNKRPRQLRPWTLCPWSPAARRAWAARPWSNALSGLVRGGWVGGWGFGMWQKV